MVATRQAVKEIQLANARGYFLLGTGLSNHSSLGGGRGATAVEASRRAAVPPSLGRSA